jgi:Glycosyl transferases group 1
MQPSRALLVTPTSPWSGSFGAQQRTALMYEALADVMPVDVLLLSEADGNKFAAGDRSEIIASLSWQQPPRTFYKYGVNEWANNWCHSNIDWSKYALVVGREFTSITKIDWPRHVRTIVDCDDAYYRYTPKTSRFADRALASVRGRLRFWQTKTAIRKYDHAFFCTARDQELFPCRSGSILPNVVHLPPEPPAAPHNAAATALIVGSMWYAPNRQGLNWFLEQCWPAVAARCPALTLRIIGAAPPGERQQWERGVRTEAPGFVEDLSAEYPSALFAIAPVNYGGGTCIKFLESAAFRKPCIVTAYVFEGFNADFRDGESVIVARDARSMVDGCVTLYENAERRRAVADRAYDTVRRLYTVERFKGVVQNAVRKLLAAPAT